MTRKEAAEKLTSLWYFLVNNDYPQKDLDALKVAIKALEQEPKAEVLDKIRAEIHATAELHEDGDYYLRDEWVDEYFDKYKAGSEDKE